MPLHWPAATFAQLRPPLPLVPAPELVVPRPALKRPPVVRMLAALVPVPLAPPSVVSARSSSAASMSEIRSSSPSSVDPPPDVAVLPRPNGRLPLPRLNRAPRDNDAPSLLPRPMLPYDRGKGSPSKSSVAAVVPVAVLPLIDARSPRASPPTP